MDNQDVQGIAADPINGDRLAGGSPEKRPGDRLVLRVRPRPGGGPLIDYALPGSVARTDAYIFDSSGRWVRLIESGPQVGGVHSMIWDGRDANGDRASSGCFFVYLAAGSAHGSGRVLSVR